MCWNMLDTWVFAKCNMSFRKCFIHFRLYRVHNCWPYCFVFGSLKFPMVVVHTDLCIGSLSILGMGQADKSCFPLVSQTEFFLICPLRPCHAFYESFGHDKSYKYVFLEEGQNVVFAYKSCENHFGYLLLLLCTKQSKTNCDALEVHTAQLF